MKTLHTILYTFIALFLVACNSNDMNVKYTLCKDKVAGRGLPGEDESYLTYKVDGSSIRIEIFNYMASCGAEKATIESEFEGDDQINVKITEIGLSANCMCPMDISFQIPNLRKGETYECVIRANSAGFNHYNHLISFPFKMEEGASGKVTF